MTEEPRLDEAVRRLMEMLDQETLRALVRTSGRALDESVVTEAEETLARPRPATLEERRRKVREEVERSLYVWLEAINDAMRHPSES